MFKGMVVNNALEMEDVEKIEEFFGRQGFELDFVEYTDRGENNYIIDTRGIDFVISPSEKSGGKNSNYEVIKFLSKMINAEGRYACLKIDGKTRYLKKSRILFIAVDGKEVCVHTIRRKYILMRQTLEQVLKDINDPWIIRCHRSYAINIRNVDEIIREKRRLWYATFLYNDKYDCPVSETYYRDIVTMYDKWTEESEIAE